MIIMMVYITLMILLASLVFNTFLNNYTYFEIENNFIYN